METLTEPRSEHEHSVDVASTQITMKHGSIENIPESIKTTREERTHNRQAQSSDQKNLIVMNWGFFFSLAYLPKPL